MSPTLLSTYLGGHGGGPVGLSEEHGPHGCGITHQVRRNLLRMSQVLVSFASMCFSAKGPALATPSLRVRPLMAADRFAVRELALINLMFAPDEMSAFDEMLSSYLDGTTFSHHWAVATSEADSTIRGACYWAPEPFADRVWNLYFIAVHPDAQRQGTGRALMDHVLADLTEAGEGTARILIVETSSTDPYQRARDFYQARGFVREATIREYYGPGDHKIVFWHRISE